MTALPKSLPVSVDQLIKELDELNPVATIIVTPVTDKDLQRLIYEAGRRSIVDELLRLNKIEESQHG